MNAEPKLARRRLNGAPISRAPLKAGTVALVVTVATIIGLGAYTQTAQQSLGTLQAHTFRLQELIATITHLDEVLTMSAGMAAATGNPRWEERYNRFEPKLDKAIKQVAAIGPDTYQVEGAARTGAANSRLVQMEREAFDLVRQGRPEDATALLLSEEYATQKKMYVQGLERSLSALQAQTQTALRLWRKRTYTALACVAIALPVILLSWIYVLRTLRKHVRERLRAEQALQKRHPQLKAQVQERTARLTDANNHLQQEIRARKRSEETLRAAHLEIEQLLSSISSILIGVNADGRISQWNRTAEATFGIAAAEAVGRHLRECGVQWNWSAIAAYISQCHAENRPVRPNDEVRFRRPDGTEGFLGITVNPLRRDSSDPSGFLLIAADITERKILESQLAQAQKLESIGQLAAGIAHEINTPTQFVGDNARFLQDAFTDLRTLLAKYGQLLEAVRAGSPTSELLAEVEAAAREADVDYLMDEIPKAIEQSLDGVGRVAKIVRSMKEFSHPGGKEKQAADLNKVIESTITVARNEWKYVAELVTDFDPSLVPVPCLVADFNQVILNIIINAAHAIAEVVDQNAGEKGTITITTRQDGDWAEIRISDTGAGIPAESRSKIFDPFFTTKEVGKGSGQGLAIAHAVVVKKHGGIISFETEVGRGTTFIIRLPVTPESDQQVGAECYEATPSVC